MAKDTARIVSVRPVAWKLSVQGREESERVRQILRGMNIETTSPQPEPVLADPPVYAFVARYSGDTPLTLEELAAILESAGQVELEIDALAR